MYHICRTLPHTINLFPPVVVRFIITPPPFLSLLIHPCLTLPSLYLMAPSLSSCSPDPSHPPFSPACRNRGSRGACIYLCHKFRDASMPIAIDRTTNRYLHRPAYLLSPVPHLLCRHVHLPVSLLPLSPLSCISAATIVRHTSPPPTLSAIPIILHLYHASIVILPHLCCGPHQIIFHRPAYFSAAVCLPSWHGSYPRSASFCTTLLTPLCSALIFSLSALIF